MGGGGGGGGFNPIRDISRTVGNAVGGDFGRVINDGGNAVGRYMLNPMGPIGVGDAVLDDLTPKTKQPDIPQISGSLTDLQAKQREKAQQFRNDLPGMKKQTATNLRADANEQANQQDQMLNQSNAARGLLYGGVNAKQKAGARAGTQEGLLKAINQSNVGFDQAADNLEAQSLDTAFGIQQSQQNIQNQLYSQAMAQMNSKNSMAAGGLGLLGSFGMKAMMG